MSSEVLSPRIAPEAGQPLPLVVSSYKPMAILGFFGLLGAICVLLAIIAADLPFRILMGSLAPPVLLIAVGFVIYQEGIREGAVRIDGSDAALRFVPPARLHVIAAAMAAAALLPAVAVLLFGAPHEVLGGGIFVYAVGAVAVGLLGRQALSLRLPPGLTLTEHGLRGVRGSKAVDIAWADLAGAQVTLSGGAAKLVFTRQGGDAIVIEPRWTGSDPNLVAPIVNYFLRHPEQRGTLSDPTAAIRLVEQAAPKR